jgi:uncharacterized membrane protein
MIEQEYITRQKLGEWISENLPTWLMRLGVLAVSLALILSLYEVVTYEQKKTNWDGLNLVMVPVAVAIVAFLLNQAQKQRDLYIAGKGIGKDYVGFG